MGKRRVWSVARVVGGAGGVDVFVHAAIRRQTSAAGSG